MLTRPRTTERQATISQGDSKNKNNKQGYAKQRKVDEHARLCQAHVSIRADMMPTIFCFLQGDSNGTFKYVIHGQEKEGSSVIRLCQMGTNQYRLHSKAMPSNSINNKCTAMPSNAVWTANKQDNVKLDQLRALRDVSHSNII